MAKKQEKKYEVMIELHSDNMSPQIQCLMFSDENGGLRLTGGKGCGRWNLIKKFKCSFTLKDLKQYELKERGK